MENIVEINMDDLEKEFTRFPIGTMLICKNEDKIYTCLCVPESIKKPIWTQLTSDYELEMKFKAISTVEKVKWLFGGKFGNLPDGTDIMSLPYGNYKPKKVDDEEILVMK